MERNIMLASEIIGSQKRISEAKDIAIISMAIATVSIAIGLSLINYRNDQKWRKKF